MTENDRITLTAISGGELTRQHVELYDWFQHHQHRVRGGGLDMTTLLLIHYLATQGAMEASEPAKPSKKKPTGKPTKDNGKAAPGDQPKRRFQAASTRDERIDDPPEPAEHSMEEQSVDFKNVKKGAAVWVLAEGGTIDGKYAGPGRNGKVYVTIAGKRESVDPDAVRIAVPN